MLDKRVVIGLLLVLLLVFSVVSVFVYKQWKHLPQLRLEPVVSKTRVNKKQRIVPRVRAQPSPPVQCQEPTPESIATSCSVSAKPPDKPSVVETVVPLLQPPEVLPEPNFECPTFAPRVEKEYVVYVDSACRDYSLYPTTQEYYFKFPQPLYNVTSVDIIQAIIPRGEYQVNVHNQTFYIQEGANTPVPITLTIGDYATDALLAAEITAQLNLAGLINTYLVTDVLYKLVFTRTVGALPFQLLLTQTEQYDEYGLVRQLLGFPPGIFQDVGGVINAPFFTGRNSIGYVDVVSPDISKNYYDSPLIARVPLLASAFNNVTEYDPQTIGTRKFWPIQRLTGLLLQFFEGPTCPPQTVLYNFNGLDNSLTLRITCQEYKNMFIDDFCIEQMV
jgi:hypothetical protein